MSRSEKKTDPRMPEPTVDTTGFSSIGADSPRWEIYDRLLAAIPPDLRIEDCLVGSHWVLVRSAGVGIAMRPGEGDDWRPALREIRGAPVREVAGLVKSWRWLTATIGLAAINSVVNAPATLRKNWRLRLGMQPHKNVFDTARRDIRGRKVAVIGHFPNLAQLASICQLSILERQPQEGDFPDPACEYILPEQDFVFITGTTLINKTLPRLLQLSRKAQVVLVGPSAPLAPFLLEKGIAQLAGTLVEDEASVWTHVAGGGDRSIFQHGARMIAVTSSDRRVP